MEVDNEVSSTPLNRGSEHHTCVPDDGKGANNQVWPLTKAPRSKNGKKKWCSLWELNPGTPDHNQQC